MGGVKIGAGIIVQGDGTISVDKTQIDTAAVASTVMFTADNSKVTLHADSVAGSEFTKDIPQASQGGAGTIDAESYAKIAETESKVNALAPTVTVNEEVDPPTITVGINGKTAQANLPSGGSSTHTITTDRLGIIKNDLSTIDSILRANVGKLASIEAAAFTKTTETSDAYYIFGVITENYQDYISGTIGIVGNGLHVNLYATELDARTFPYITALISANIRTDISTLAFRYITNSGIAVHSPHENFRYRLIIFD